jgi:hypothetical protein
MVSGAHRRGHRAAPRGREHAAPQEAQEHAPDPPASSGRSITFAVGGVMDHATIDPALKTWAAALTDVPVACVLWENEPRVHGQRRSS